MSGAAAAAQAVASIAAGKPIMTHSEGMTTTSWGVWTLVFLAVPLVIGGLFRFIPAMRKLANERSGSLDDERRTDMDEMRTDLREMRDELRKMREEVNSAKDKAQTAENKLVAAVSAVSLLSAEVRRNNPDSPVLAQVQELLAAATSGDFGLGAGLDRIARAV